MYKTKIKDSIYSTRLLVGVEELRAMLSCGIVTAKKIGEDAGASIKIGKRRLFNVEKIKEYLATITEESKK